MDWKKSNFLITIKSGDEIVRKKVSGIVASSEEFPLGIYKTDSKDWIVTDISTGYQIKMENTQKAAKFWVEKNLDSIEKILAKPEHEKHIQKIEKYRIVE